MLSRLTNALQRWQLGSRMSVTTRMFSGMVGQLHYPVQPPTGNVGRLQPFAPISRRQNLHETDALLDGIFARSIPLPHAISESCNQGNSLDFLATLPIGIPPQEEISMMNRNARRPTRSNKGSRPCSRSSRRWKKSQIGKRSRGGRK